ncbi:MAG: hypothetical protein JNL28_01540 [Planctomycetes bacterium]|nr:hypothetical protein [Planctomycetota bacterium]
METNAAQSESSADRKRSSLRILVALAAGVALAWLAAEAILRATVDAKALLDPNTDAYWREHFRAEPRLAPDIEHDEILGWRMRRNWRADGVTHDEHGHRVTPHPESKALRTHAPIVLLGDSFTYGLGVRDAETYAARLAELVTDRAVINTGTNGWGLDQQVRAFETEIAGLRPALVVVGYFLDDFRRNGLSFREGAKPRFVLQHDGLRLDPATVPPPDEARRALGGGVGGSYVWAALCALERRLAGTRGAYTSDAEFENHAQISERLLARLARSVRDVDAQLLVLTIPHCRYEGYPDAERIEQEITAACARLKLAHVSTTPLCKEAEARGVTVFNTLCHWSSEGHALVARMLAEHIAGLGLER